MHVTLEALQEIGIDPANFVDGSPKFVSATSAISVSSSSANQYHYGHQQKLAVLNKSLCLNHQ
jgi:hypothetical protein